MNIPSQLLIGYNNIHPFLFYFSFIFGLMSIIWVRRSYCLKLYNIFLMASFALLLGGLWGLGNSVWGFFWVNDQIEVILLLYVLLLLYLLHVYIQKENVLRAIIFLIFLIFSLFFLRWGFSFTRHNFFNLKLLVNIIVSFNFLFYNFFAFFIPSFFTLVFYTNIVLFICFLIFNITTYNTKYKTFMYFFHIFLLVLIVSWLKYRNNNYVISSLLYVFLANSGKFTSFKIITFFSVFKPLFYKLSFLVIKSHLYMSSKLLILPYKVYISYYLIYWWYIMLVSMNKIYTK